MSRHSDYEKRLQDLAQRRLIVLGDRYCMAATQDITRSTATHLQHLISQVSANMRTMEVTEYFVPILELGSGSYGNVLLAKHRHSGQMAAVKRMAKEKTPMDDFLMEFGISLSLSCHPHIITTYELAFQTSMDYVFVQEVAPAGTLLSIVKPNVGLEEELLKRCILQICTALDFMHSRGLVHRDIKLDNILLMDFSCHRVKLSDFGLTRLQGTYVPPMASIIPYMAPELCSLDQGEHLLLNSSLDVWAFGVLIYSALLGSVPWKEAVYEDDQYIDFAWWQILNDITTAPGGWKKISLAARYMFWDILAINSSERCSAMDIVKYIHLPWKGGTFG
ncbi:serine/threonine-protein kinase SBK1-like [Hyperolius riggenbachi]|uniref:serine/threonine-protein kinase SBK1-like n=1 Tax=Hyperolius riggenbachi TaxID=752182 RepID=UPI0035A2B034